MNRSDLAAIRFGHGPASGAPGDGATILASLGRPDDVAARHPLMTLSDARAMEVAFRDAGKAAREGGPEEQAARDALEVELNEAVSAVLPVVVARATAPDSPFRERLTAFWADHFTVRGLNRVDTLFYASYHDTIRAKVTGSFAELLTAVVQSPSMLRFLDQDASTGPNSPVGLKRKRGLNENLARELLELHTMGVDGAYTQADVRELAELLTGLTYDWKEGVWYRAAAAEPGAETVLGQSYGGGAEDLAHVHAFLADVSVHPDTARHVSGKLAAHFVADEPDPDLVAAMTAAWKATGGDLMSVYAVLLDHPAAWEPELRKVKQPFDFMVSSLVALGLDDRAVAALPRRDFHRHVDIPMRQMGQRAFAAPGPDGWPEEPEAWITPQGLAMRIRWAMTRPSVLLDKVLPEPSAFVDRALASAAPDELRLAVSRAETQSQAVALVLASPSFNRR